MEKIGGQTMALTRDFKETIRARAERDPKFRRELLREGIECMLSGDIATAKTIIRDYINATRGFAEVAEHTRIPSKSLMRRLGPAGNPRADNLFEVVSFLQHRHAGRVLTYERLRSIVFVDAAETYRCRAGHSDRPMEPRRMHRPRGPRSLAIAQAHSVHHGPQDAADYDREGPGAPR